MYQRVTERKFIFFDKNLSKSSEFYYLEPGLYPSITDFVEAMNTIIQERHNRSENCCKVKVSRKTQKLRFTLEMKHPVLPSLVRIWDTNSEVILVMNKFGVMLRGKGPHKPEFAYDIVRIHSLMIYTDLIEYNIVGDTKSPLLRCFPFFSKHKSGDIITTGQYMNFQTFSNLQFRPLLKNSFHNIHIDLRDTSGEKIPFVSVGITRLVLMFRKASNIHFQSKRRYKMVASKEVEIPYYRGVGRQRWRGHGALAQVIGRTENCNSIFA